MSLLEDCDKRRVLFYTHIDELIFDMIKQTSNLREKMKTHSQSTSEQACINTSNFYSQRKGKLLVDIMNISKLN